MRNINWSNVMGLNSHTFTCGYCGHSVAAEKGWQGKNPTNAQLKTHIYICHQCTRPNFFDFRGRQHPGALFGRTVEDIEDDTVEALYEEARRAAGAGSFTAVVLCCRKLLMHIAVSKEADPDQSFLYYVNYLADNHYVPPDAKEWVDHIRQMGNEANHEIVIMSADDAQELIAFIGMLMKVIYEFPAAIARRTAEE